MAEASPLPQMTARRFDRAELEAYGRFTAWYLEKHCAGDRRVFQWTTEGPNARPIEITVADAVHAADQNWKVLAWLQNNWAGVADLMKRRRRA